MSSATGHNSDVSRPRWVWAIVIFFALSGLWTGLGFLLATTGAIPLTEAQQTYFEQLGPFEWFHTALSGCLALAFAIQLFRLRSSALPLVVAAFVLNVAATAWHLASTNWAEAVGPSGLAGAVLAWAGFIAIIFYCQRLKARSVLT